MKGVPPIRCFSVLILDGLKLALRSLARTLFGGDVMCKIE